MRVLVFTAATGGGHRRTAAAVQKYVEDRMPGVEVKTVDAIKEVNKVVDSALCGTYELLATKAPKLYGFIYEQTQKEGLDISKPLTMVACRRLMRAINAFDPDVIITTHPFAGEMVSSLKQMGKVNKPLLAIMTDYGPHRAYLAKNVDAYVVPAPDCVEPMVKLGVNRKKIYPFGIPVFEQFRPAKPEQLPALREELELTADPRLPTILVMAGSFGVSNISAIYDSLMALEEQFQLIIITGRNEKLYKAFQEKTKHAPKPVKLVFFTDVVEKYMQCSDLIITKPGGLTISESIACDLPMVLFQAIPGQEEDNAAFLTGKGMAVEIPKDQDGARIVADLIRNPEKLQKMHHACHAFDTSKCRENLGKLMVSLAKPYAQRQESLLRNADQVYLDNSATTRVCHEAVDKMMEMMTNNYGNPSSIHGMGITAEQELTAARETIAKALGAAKASEITFTSCGTEADNMAVFGAVELKKRLGNKIVTTAIEHPAVARCMDQLEQQGYEVVRLQPDSQGHIDPDAVYDAIDERTILVSMMLVNNEVGTVLPVDAAAKAILRKQSPALLHVDAVQAFGKMPIKVKRMKVDLMTISGHKVHGPKGVGALYIRDGIKLPPLILGGGQEKNLRSGTEALPAIAGFGAAVQALPDLEDALARAQQLCDYCRSRLQEIPGVVFNSPEDALPYIVNFSTMSIRSETMINFLSEKHIYVSGGSACSGGKDSPVLGAMGVSRSAVLSSIRVSFSMDTTEEDVNALIEGVKEGVATLAGNLKA